MNKMPSKAGGPPLLTQLEIYHGQRTKAAAEAIAASMQRRRADAAGNLCDGHYEVLER